MIIYSTSFKLREDPQVGHINFFFGKNLPGPTVTELFTMTIDIDKQLPVAATDVKKGPDGDIHLSVEFKYPKTGPADIYEAGAPKTAKITPSPEQ